MGCLRGLKQFDSQKQQQQNKTETRMTATVLKENPNTQSSKEPYVPKKIVLISTHCPVVSVA